MNINILTSSYLYKVLQSKHKYKTIQ